MISEERAAELFAENAELRERIAEIARDAQGGDRTTAMAAIFEADDRLALNGGDQAARMRWHLSRATCRRDRDEERGHQDGEVLQGEVRKGGCVTTYSLFHDAPLYATEPHSRRRAIPGRGARGATRQRRSKWASMSDADGRDRGRKDLPGTARDP